MSIYAKTSMETMPGSCTECMLGKRYGCVGDVQCKILNEYFTGNVEPPYKERPDECPLEELVGTEPVCDESLEKWWTELADVAFDDPGVAEDLVLAEAWRHFEKGTKREDIWHWFDEHHSKGVVFLMYGRART